MVTFFMILVFDHRLINYELKDLFIFDTISSHNYYIINSIIKFFNSIILNIISVKVRIISNFINRVNLCDFYCLRG